jgi:hypothetical protein
MQTLEIQKNLENCWCGSSLSPNTCEPRIDGISFNLNARGSTPKLIFQRSPMQAETSVPAQAVQQAFPLTVEVSHGQEHLLKCLHTA